MKYHAYKSAVTLERDNGVSLIMSTEIVAYAAMVYFYVFIEDDLLPSYKSQSLNEASKWFWNKVDEVNDLRVQGEVNTGLS